MGSENVCFIGKNKNVKSEEFKSMKSRDINQIKEKLDASTETKLDFYINETAANEKWKEMKWNIKMNEK